METMEISDFEQKILKLGLVNEAQLIEVHEEIGNAVHLQQLIAALERKGYLTPWQRGKVLKGDTDGFIMGGYRLLYKVQSGSFGRVYRAEDPRDGRVVAVKVLRKRWSEDEKRIEMFIREGKVGLQLKHPNIVEVLAISRDQLSGSYYIVMEFVEGGNLREILQIRPNNKMPVAESLGYIEDCANGLAYAYARGMTHRDIKLTNILISDTRQAKLVDFGLAQFFSTLAKREEEKVDRTVDYAGLERATGVKIGDERSDIYFLGCVLYECLTGRSPLTMTRDKYARMRKGRFEEVKPIHPSEIDGPPSVLVLVETMMALDPSQRYQTPAQLLDAVRALRREVEGKSGKHEGRTSQRAVFIVEPDEHLQDVFRDKLKDQGYRVFLAGDPQRAWDRFRQQPYDGLIVDARTTGEEGFRIFDLIVDEAARRHLRCAALLLLDEEQADWEARLPSGPHIGVLSQDVTFKTVSRKLKELMEAAHNSQALPVLVRPAPAPPPAPTPRVVEAPPPPAPTPLVIEIPPPPRKKAAPPPPPVSVPRVVKIPLSPRDEEDEDFLDDDDEGLLSSPPPKEAAPPPHRREPKPASPPAAFSPSLSPDEDMPLLAPEQDNLLPPRPEVVSPPRREAVSPPQEAVPPPRRQEPIPPPRPDPMAAVAFSPPSEEAVTLPRPAQPRRQTALPPTKSVVREKPPAPLPPPDIDNWRDELRSRKEKKEPPTARLQKWWADLSPTQKKGIGIGSAVLVLLLFFASLVPGMITKSKVGQIAVGMSEKQVELIMGEPGKELNMGPSKNKPVSQPKVIPNAPKDSGKLIPGAATLTIKTWKRGKTTIRVIFRDGKVAMVQENEQ